ncbi:MAG: glycosyltransferase family 2 protein [Saprospiraceae bacterium]|nr:glycosyltransferase family 2 protein [Saprospiraceae bacterium]
MFSLKLSIVIPIYNEEENIKDLYHRICKTIVQITDQYEIIFINDGSKDLSMQMISDLAESDSHVFFIDLSRNFGHQIAVTAGLEASKGEAVVIIDADLQDPPELIIELYAKLNEGFEVVYATRIKREGEGFFKKITAKLFYKLLSSITSFKIPVDTGDYRIISRKVVELLKIMPEQNKFLRGQIAWLGFNQTQIYFNRPERMHGKSGYSYSKMLNFAIDGITSITDIPLKLVTRLGLFISLFSFVVILYAIYSHFILHRTITGWTSLIISSAFIGGVQLFSLGIIGEYISRMNRNILKRPLYIVNKTNIGS